MQQIGPTHEQPDIQETTARPRLLRRRLAISLAIVSALVLLVLLIPFINVNRYQRRIAASISGSLGRPVHLDRVTLSLLPLPGFTLENLVVSEDPAFGYEPIIRANEVRATLRLSSLWRGRVEFSTIHFSDPSLNLVHMPDGKWNIEDILLQASRVAAAPTAQEKAGPAPRFPYIEASGARVNLKQGGEKTPFSLADADLALWLPNPEQWRLRLQGRPVRTDTSVSDTGAVRLEATLGRARSLEEVPLELDGSWRGAPLGEATTAVFGRDAGWRGELTLETSIRGTMGKSAVQTRLRVNDARREEFVPEQPLGVDLECRGNATNLFHSFSAIQCSWPPGGGDRKIAVSGAVPDVRDWRASTAEAGIADLPASALVGWWRVLSPRVPVGVSAEGTMTGSLTYNGTQTGRLWDGELMITGAKLRGGGTAVGAADGDLVTGDISLRPVEPPTLGLRNHRAPAPSASSAWQLEPVSLNLGGKDPATLTGQIGESGMTLHLAGTATSAGLDMLAKTIPQLGDGLAAVLPTDGTVGPFRVDWSANRPWGGAQVWHDNMVRPVAPLRRRNR